jgi:type I restriction enzyme S subunit
VSWKTVKLGDVCTLRNGRAYRKPELLLKGKYPVLRVGNFFTNKNWYYSDLELDDTKYCDTGDLLYAWSASFGPRIWKGERVIYHYHIWRVDFDYSLIDKKYLFYWFEFDKELIKLASGTGTTMMHVSKGSMEKRELVLPPLAQQKRIVAKLDSAFSEIDTAISATVNNVRNAVQIYEYAIDKLFNEHNEKSQPIGNFANINYGYTAKASFEIGSYKFLRITDIQDGKVDWDKVPYCEVEPKKRPKFMLNDGDIVFARTGATTGKSFLVRNPHNTVFASYLIRVSINREILLADYVMHYFQSADYWRQVEKGISGAAQGGFNASKLSELRIPMIDLATQKKVSKRLSLIVEKTQTVKAIYLHKIDCLTTLKSALLAHELKGESG